jgi:3-vinyl bacteriochlorophyllide hydratase
MKASDLALGTGGFKPGAQGFDGGLKIAARRNRPSLRRTVSSVLNGWLDMIAPCPWSGHIGLTEVAIHTAWPDQGVLGIDLSRGESRPQRTRTPLYSAAERQRRDTSPWTIVQGVLAPIQFLAFAVSLMLIGRYMLTGQGYGLATASILVKTFLLYAIMITGSIWEKVVFGKWLFARAFFWEDVFSMVVLGLQTTYLALLLLKIGTPAQQILVAIAAYAAYAINASQFLLKLREARLEAARTDLTGLVA